MRLPFYYATDASVSLCKCIGTALYNPFDTADASVPLINAFEPHSL